VTPPVSSGRKPDPGSGRTRGAARPDVPGLRNLILQVSHRCNLRCRYCGADFGRYGGSFRDMGLPAAKKAIDILFGSSEPVLAVTYFGGEPLLNLDTVVPSARYLREKARRDGRELSLHLVTNGVLLTPETLMILDQLGFSLTVSLDGPPGIHDRCRPGAGGGGSYRQTARALELAGRMPIGQRITVRGTFTRESAAFGPNIRFLAERRFSRNIAYEPVFLPSSHPLALRWKDLPRIREAYSGLARHYVSRWKRGDPFCLWDLDDAVTQVALQRPRKSRCGAGVTTAAVTAEGDIYACHMSTGMPGAWLGTLKTGIEPSMRRPWREKYLRGRSGCEGCRFLSLCGGGCNAHALFYNGTLSRPYRLECKLIEHRYRLASKVLAELPDLGRRIRASAGEGGGESDAGHAVSPLWSYCSPCAPCGDPPGANP
jgi:uncharacterized protein